jgi:uncharacterized protein
VYISLQDLELHPVHFVVDIPTGEIDYDDKIAASTAMHVEGDAQLANRTLSEVRVRGRLSVTVEAPCDRCLETATFPIERQFDLVYLPAAQQPAGGEDKIDEGATDIGYYEGDGLELNDVLREVVLLALPMQLVCQESCKGICPSCGRNRNFEDCDCQAQPMDDRWSKLKAFRVEISHKN